MNLSLAEQFVLLAHRLAGRHDRAGNFAGAAELGDLLLWRRIQLSGYNVVLFDPTPTGIAGLDGALGILHSETRGGSRSASIQKYVVIRSPIRAGNTSALVTHRSSLVGRGFVQCRKHRTLGIFSRDRYFPDQNAWSAVVGELRAFVRHERQDPHLLLLASLVWATGLTNSLPMTDPERASLKQFAKSTEFGPTIRKVFGATS